MGTIVLLAFLLLAAVAGLIVGVKLKKSEAKRSGSYGANASSSSSPWLKRGAFIASAVFGSVFLLVLGFNSYYTQDPGEAVVIKSFSGSVVGHTEESGIHFTAPWNSTESFNVRNQSIEMYSNEGGEGADGAALDVPLKGGAKASVSVTVIYSINPSAVEHIYDVFRNQQGLKDNALKPNLRAVVRDLTAGYTPIQIRENRGELGARILADLNTKWAPYGVVVDQVNLGQISLDEKTEEAIQGVITEQQNVEKVRAQLQAAQLGAEVTKTNAQAAADADQIIRCGATTKTETRDVDGKPTQVVIVTPKPNSECENRLNEQVLATKWFDTIKEAAAKGNLVVIAPNDGSAPILQLPAQSQAPEVQPQPGG